VLIIKQILEIGILEIGSGGNCDRLALFGPLEKNTSPHQEFF
jgi:hypothetical protein